MIMRIISVCDWEKKSFIQKYHPIVRVSIVMIEQNSHLRQEGIVFSMIIIMYAKRLAIKK
jgi:hypothetical protein